ncbi:retinoic acid receptor gamma-A-like isoform X3 [Leptotrombidium deliense]|uniref:Retinoic acid receptor gamma-A-like isoform X3 n=1 Tax=Leptotrombidium deliense TaxID=299467 RepID=A0A443SQI8_9ACAR|nr:retinoic acid receptor gamma-A-like isoform X3 [Leptotrombidium deliense]
MDAGNPANIPLITSEIYNTASKQNTDMQCFPPKSLENRDEFCDANHVDTSLQMWYSMQNSASEFFQGIESNWNMTLDSEPSSNLSENASNFQELKFLNDCCANPSFFTELQELQRQTFTQQKKIQQNESGNINTLIPTVVHDQSPTSNFSPKLVIDDGNGATLMPELSSEITCGVCGGPASGKHYNAVTCEGCKGFFRRVVVSKTVYNCTSEKNCRITRENRRKSCRGCRFRKCVAIGMKPELCIKHGNSRLSSKKGIEDNLEEEQTWKYLMAQVEISYQGTIQTWISRVYSKKNLQLQQAIETIEPNEIIGDMFRIHLEMECNTMISGIRLFRQLRCEDQNKIIKNSANNIALLLICNNYDYVNKKIKWPNGVELSSAQLKSTKLAPVVDNIFHLSQELYDLKPSWTETGIMIALCFASANGTKDHFKGIYDQMSDVLKEYSRIYRANYPNFSQKICNILEFTKEFSSTFSEIVW